MKETLAVLVFVFLSMAVSPVVAQEATGKIEGRLADDKGDPVGFVNVVVSGPTIVETRGVMSTSEGYFVIASLPPGTYSVRIFHISYNELVLKDVVVIAGQTSDLGDLVLTEGIIEMSPIVVTASRTEQPLESAPAAMTVLTNAQIEQLPIDDYQDVFRLVPGVNAMMTSAGDISINTRRATGAIPTGQLGLMDNRTIAFEANGAVVWSALPINPREIKQIEVLRGPNSAMWGANSMDGVVNIITKAPREMQGTSVMLGAGEIDTRYASLTHAGVRGRLGYKVTGGYYEQAAYERPTGTIPGTDGPTNPGGTPYPSFPNKGTEQPKINGRVDYYQDEKTMWSLSGGYAGISGLFLTPSGPFEMGVGDYMAYAQADWHRQAMEVNLYANIARQDGAFLLIPGVFTGNTETYHVNFSDARLLGERNLVTYGGSVRYNEFDDISLTPNAPNRDEYGVFLQDEFRWNEKFTAVLGARVDNIDPMGTAVSPRVSLLFSPVSGNTIRLSYNRAYRAPTVVENYIFVQGAVVITVPPPAGPLDLTFPLVSVGNPDLSQEQLDSFEIGWLGNWRGRVEATLSFYYTELRDLVHQAPVEFYTSSNPPPNWPLPDSLLDIPPPNGFAGIPSKMTFLNFGQTDNQGVEASIAINAPKGISIYMDYSYQRRRQTEGIPTVPLQNGQEIVPLNVAPENRFNAAVVWDSRLYYANAAITYQDVAFWTDVFDSRFWGPTDAFTAVNLGAGVRLFRDQINLSLNANNILDERVQQHVFSDIINRKIWVQLIYRM